MSTSLFPSRGRGRGRPLPRLTFLFALAACAPPAKSTPSTTTTATATTKGVGRPMLTFALAQSTAPLPIAPDETSSPVRLFETDDEASQAKQDDPNPIFRVLGVKSGFVEIETAWDPDHPHCHDGLPALSAFALRFFVRREALALVTTGAVDVDYGDGTGVTIAAGVVVRDVGGRFEAAPSGFWVKTPLDGDAVGDSYEPSPPFQEAKEPFGVMKSPLKHGVRFGGEILPYFPSTHQPAWAEAITLDEGKKTPQGISATIVERCARYRVLLDPEDVDESYGLGGLGLMGTGGSSAPRVRRGATIRWANGAIAGLARVDSDPIPDLVGGNGRSCWHQALRVEGGPNVLLCVADADLI